MRIKDLPADYRYMAPLLFDEVLARIRKLQDVINASLSING
ncbi:hypothetical protein [Microvirga yunnanensis]|nr:hypothetical protein [Microvirga sp. HBU65207]